MKSWQKKSTCTKYALQGNVLGMVWTGVKYTCEEMHAASFTGGKGLSPSVTGPVATATERMSLKSCLDPLEYMAV